MPNPRPELPEAAVSQPEFFKANDGTQLQIFRFSVSPTPRATVFLAPGITGMNPAADRDLLEVLAGAENQVVVIFPRGTGYSGGVRGDVDLKQFVEDFTEGVRREIRGHKPVGKVFIFGHSMSCAVALEALRSVDGVAGVILVNPPFKRKEAKGMTPGFWEYVRYAAYMLFAPRTPVVNMAGDPERMADPADQAEARLRNKDPWLVKYFSMRVMLGVQKLLAGMLEQARRAPCPLLLIHGGRDQVVDETGCREIFSAWKDPRKQWLEVPEGPHGKATVLASREAIQSWLRKLENE